jgi:hypothetical protein
MFRLLFTFTLTTIMIATAGFGALPENPLTDTFRTVLGGILPPDLLNPLDSYLEMVSSPQIQPKLASVSDGAPPSDIAPTEQPPLDPVGWLFSLLERNNNAALPAASSLDATQIALAATQTQVVFLQSVTSTYTQISTGHSNSINCAAANCHIVRHRHTDFCADLFPSIRHIPAPTANIYIYTYLYAFSHLYQYTRRRRRLL